MAGINLAAHRGQVEADIRERETYVLYAEALKRALEQGCKGAFPQAMVQARAKEVGSFAEKAARKFEKYRDALHQMTDLCGGRVTVQTLEQVRAVRAFVEANFRVLEQDDKSARLEEDRFGYRDVHYVVQLRGDREVGITAEERAVIGERKAEIQVRTWVQHAWADTLHDRIYKTKLRLPAETKRTGNLLAAVLEEGDRAFDRLAGEVDGMLANYSAHAPREDVEKEVAVIEAVLANLPAKAGDDGEAERARLLLRLAKLVSRAYGDDGRVVEILGRVEDIGRADGGLLRREILTELGFANCRLWREKRECAGEASAGYWRGQEMLQEALGLGMGEAGEVALDARKSRSLQARGWARLAWSWEAAGAVGETDVLRCYRKALELEPENPYYLADILGFERFATGARELAASTRIAAGRAIEVCREHVRSGIEMPYACFTAGRLSLLMGDGDGALGWYARGICHCRQAASCVPGDAVAHELGCVARLQGRRGEALASEQDWVKALLTLAQGMSEGGAAMERVKALATRGVPPLTVPAVIVAGGAASLPTGQVEGVGAMLTAALERFEGTVISGGTRVGVPGCAGAAAEALKGRGSKRFVLAAYLPETLNTEVVKDERYDQLVTCGTGFSVEQVLRMWADLMAGGAKPADVVVLGFGGGAISALEYRLGLALGARVGVVMESGGAAGEILKDEVWAGEERLLPLPADGMTLRAFVQGAGGGAGEFSAEVVEEMGKALHQRHLARRVRQVPEGLRPWVELDETYRQASLEQARYAIRILEAAGFGVREARGGSAFGGFSREELERMAELEHGRWNVERLKSGWRPGVMRDNARKVHPLIVPWGDAALARHREDDFDAVRGIPEILARAGLEVFRKG